MKITFEKYHNELKINEVKFTSSNIEMKVIQHRVIRKEGGYFIDIIFGLTKKGATVNLLGYTPKGSFRSSGYYEEYDIPQKFDSTLTPIPKECNGDRFEKALLMAMKKAGFYGGCLEYNNGFSPTFHEHSISNILETCGLNPEDEYELEYMKQ